MKVLAIGASNSKDSINRVFAGWAARQLPGASVELLDINEFPMPIYSKQLEAAKGAPASVAPYLERISNAELIVISMAENNSSYNAGFKNLYDWVSRTEKKQWQGKPMLLLSTAPGPGGGKHVLAQAQAMFPFHGADIKGTFTLPQYNQNFDEEKGIINETLKEQFLQVINAIQS